MTFPASLKIGFSDHSIGPQAACQAVALGAKVFEKHFTINKNLNEKQKDHAVEHEKLHILQMRSGRSWYDNNNIYHKPKKDEPIQVYKRVGNKMIVKGNAMGVGDPKNPVEKEVYSLRQFYHCHYQI